MDEELYKGLNFGVKLKNVILVFLPVHFVMLFTSLLPNSKFSAKFRGKLLAPFLKECGKNFQVANGVTINQIQKLSVGDNVYIAHYAWLNATGGLLLDDGVVVGPFSVIVTTRHAYEDGFISNTKSYVSPVRIGKGCWLASHVVVNKGVTIGQGVIVGAGSVVTKNVKPYEMIAGVPAVFIKHLDQN